MKKINQFKREITIIKFRYFHFGYINHRTKGKIWFLDLFNHSMREIIDSIKALFTIPDDWYSYYEG